MKKTLSIIFSLTIGLTAFTQVQIDKSLQLTGSGSNAKIAGIQEVSANPDAANKIYVDTAIANRAGGSSSSTWADFNTLSPTVAKVRGPFTPPNCLNKILSNTSEEGRYAISGDLVLYRGSFIIRNNQCSSDGDKFLLYVDVNLPLEPSAATNFIMGNVSVGNYTGSTITCASLSGYRTEIVNEKLRIYPSNVPVSPPSCFYGGTGEPMIVGFPNSGTGAVTLYFNVIYQKK